MDSTQRWDRLARQTGAAGLAGTVLVFASVIAVSGLGEPPLHADEQEVVAFFDATAAAGWYEAAETVVVIGSLVLLWSLVGLGLLLRRAEGQPGWRSAMVVVSAGLFAAVGFVVARFVWTSEAWLVPYSAFWVWFLAVCIHLLRKPGSLSAATP